MKPISETLREIAGQRQVTRNGATIYIVIDDEDTFDEPMVQEHHLTNKQLARSNDRRLVRTVLERSIETLLNRWRGGD